jgi:SAM-dependent methyltransferase
MSDWYNRIYHFNIHYRTRWVENQAAIIPRGSWVLDVGAGIAPYRSFFHHCKYVTQDFCQEPGTIGNYTGIDYISDITSIPVADAAFDAILCTEVLEHVPEPIRAGKELARILRPGGRLLLSAPLGAFLHQEPYHYYGGFTPYWYRKFLPEAGFEILTIEANRGFFSFFGQEAVRFHSLIDPRRLKNQGSLTRVLLTLLWMMTLPICRGFFPLLAGFFDGLGLEHMATIGYHVVAIRK